MKSTMTPETANRIFNMFGDIMADNLLLKPSEWPSELRRLFRNQRLGAVFLWLAKQRFEGVDLLLELELQPGQFVAPLQLADMVIPCAAYFPDVEGVGGATDFRIRDHGKKRDSFVALVLNLDASDSAFWDKVYGNLSWMED